MGGGIFPTPPNLKGDKMKKTILGILIGLMIVVLMGLSFSQRAIETTDYILIHASDGESYKVHWSFVETFVEQNLDTLPSAIVKTMPIVTGTADSVYLDYSPNVAVLTAGLEVTWIAYDVNTGAVTLTMDALTEKAVIECSDLTALDAGDIDSLMVVRCVYDGTQWQQISQSGN